MMTDKPSRDPRTEAVVPISEQERGIAPVIRVNKNGPSGLALGIGAVVAGILLFAVLDSRRRALEIPTVRQSTADAIGLPPAPPALFIPPEPAQPPPVTIDVAPTRTSPPSSQFAAASVQPQIVYVPQSAPQLPGPLPVARNSSSPVLVLDNGVPDPATANSDTTPNAAGTNARFADGERSTGRTRAGMFANKATTVPQGTLIPAVLETAFNSTQAGFARAIVSRDVRGFDGTHVLIPRGSRLIGEYGADVAPGQKRALIAWSRLIRPDGVTIAINSPATDTLGRGGIEAKMNSHFFERFSGALLQSTLDAGVSVAASSASKSVVVLPGNLTGSTAQVVQPTKITPTLKVAQGTSISIFVARDLDFTMSDQGR